MGCNFPRPAWQRDDERLRFKAPSIREADQFRDLAVPCGKCLGCRSARAQAWALRCRLEWSQHADACWCTLTYAEKYKPPTLQRKHLQAYLKRLRARESDRVVRFFGCGEYGERTARPHYHVILFGLSRHNPHIEAAWGMGHVRVDPLTPAAINYVAGYVSKKIGIEAQVSRERVDPETGEVYKYQAPFLQMSRRPGIGGEAREHTQSWRDYAINDGVKQAVPRYLHEAWINSVPLEVAIAHKEARRAQAVQLAKNGETRELLLTERYAHSSTRRTL